MAWRTIASRYPHSDTCVPAYIPPYIRIHTIYRDARDRGRLAADVGRTTREGRQPYSTRIGYLSEDRSTFSIRATHRDRVVLYYAIYLE